MSPASTDAPSGYRELAPRAELRDLLLCRWEQRVAAPREKRIVPDGCADVVWLGGRELIVAGPATRAIVASLPAGSTTVGVRFRIGAADAPLGLPLTALRDGRVPLAELWGAACVAPLEEALATAPTPGAQLYLLESALLARRAETPAVDRLALAAVAEIGGTAPRVRDLATTLGVSERQLLRRLRAAVGYGPATLARVMRFQRALAAAWADPAAALGGGLARIAADAGYADQPHFARDCRELAGVPPTTLLRGG